jgi:hypothetical protein
VSIGKEATMTDETAETVVGTDIDERISAVFRAVFEGHPDRDTDPASALDDARGIAAAIVPAGVTGFFDDEHLTFTAATAGSGRMRRSGK